MKRYKQIGTKSAPGGVTVPVYRLLPIPTSKYNIKKLLSEEELKAVYDNTPEDTDDGTEGHDNSDRVSTGSEQAS